MLWGSRTVTWRRPDSSGRCCSNCTQNRVPSAMLMERLPSRRRWRRRGGTDVAAAIFSVTFAVLDL